jgi:hypothetical protein
MKCRKFQDWISLEIDGQLPPEKVRPLQDHLLDCDACRAYREDLRIGLRMLHATDPVLPDNFDWKLQLKLSQTLRETAREATYPWHEDERGWRRWFSRAGISAAVGTAAVLAVAVLAPGQLVPVLPADAGGAVALTAQPLRLPLQTPEEVSPLLDTSRRPLESVDPLWSAGGLQRPVSTGVGGGAVVSWPGFVDHGLLRIRQLEQEVQSMRRRMVMKDRQIDLLQARLDSLTGQAVDKR